MINKYIKTLYYTLLKPETTEYCVIETDEEFFNTGFTYGHILKDATKDYYLIWLVKRIKENE